jgi:hypothetical protein
MSSINSEPLAVLEPLPELVLVAPLLDVLLFEPVLPDEVCVLELLPPLLLLFDEHAATHPRAAKATVVHAKEIRFVDMSSSLSASGRGPRPCCAPAQS